MKKLFLHNKKGFISTYFLAILLYITSIITVIALRDRENIQTILNIKEINTYFQMEVAIINDIKCRLLNDALNDGEEVSINDIAYTYEVGESTIYIATDIEELYVTYDSNNKKVMDYYAYRK